MHKKLTLKLFISISLIVLIYGRSDLSYLTKTILSISLKSSLTISALYILGQAISSLKWRIFIQSAGLNRNLPTIVKAYFFGMFVNTMAFGTLGGDLARSVALKPKEGEKALSFSTVLADRVHGLFVLLCLGTISALVFHPKFIEELPTFLLPTGILLIGLAWYFFPIISTKIFKNNEKLNKLLSLFSAAFSKNPSSLITASLISFFFHSLQIFIQFLIAKELKMPVSLQYLFVVVPIINFLSSLPISINGIGIREASSLFFFIPLGIEKNVAIAFAALWIVMTTIVGLLSGLVVFSSKDLVILNQEDKLNTESNG